MVVYYIIFRMSERQHVIFRYTLCPDSAQSQSRVIGSRPVTTTIGRIRNAHNAHTLYERPIIIMTAPAIILHPSVRAYVWCMRTGFGM